MILNQSNLIGTPVLSLHLGGPIGNIVREIVDPNDLKIIAFEVDGPQTGDGEHGYILDIRSVREYSNLGMIVDSIDDLVTDGDVIRIDKVRELNFSVIGLNVKTTKGAKLGRVIDYTYEPESMQIMQFYVKRPLMKSFLDSELIIGRSEVKEINDYDLIVKDETSKGKKTAKKEDFVPNFVNPFREGKFATNEATLEEDE